MMNKHIYNHTLLHIEFSPPASQIKWMHTWQPYLECRLFHKEGQHRGLLVPMSGIEPGSPAWELSRGATRTQSPPALPILVLIYQRKIQIHALNPPNFPRSSKISPNILTLTKIICTNLDMFDLFTATTRPNRFHGDAHVANGWQII